MAGMPKTSFKIQALGELPSSEKQYYQVGLNWSLGPHNRRLQLWGGGGIRRWRNAPSLMGWGTKNRCPTEPSKRCYVQGQHQHSYPVKLTPCTGFSIKTK